jgi:hypothetical protein
MLLIYCWGDFGNLIIKKKAKYDELKNIYSLENDGKIFTLVSLSTKQVYEDHLKLKEKSEVEEKYQPCKDKRKSENKVIKERKKFRFNQNRN